MKKFRDWLFKFWYGVDRETMALARKALKEQISNVSPSSFSGLNDTYLFDFKNLLTQYQNIPVVDMMNPNGQAIPIAGGSLNPFIEAKVPDKIKIKPIDALTELETVPTPFTLIGLDEKIYMMKTKEDLIAQHYAKREINALIQRLENRKKYPEHKTYFDSFQNTTDEKIDSLLGKYQLVMKTSDIFVPEFPDIAIKRMKEYEDKVKLICEKKPVFYVIAEEKDFVKKYEKRDPILLVQSPFGFYWQILGAWDKEMLLLSEL